MKRIIDKINVVYLLKHLVYLITAILSIAFLKHCLNINIPENNKLQNYISNNYGLFFFAVVIFSPFLEEYVFRKCLKNCNHFWIIISLLVLFIFSSKFTCTKLLLTLFIFNIIAFQFWKANTYIYKTLIFMSIVAFVSVHLNNYSKNELSLLRSIDVFFMVLPYIIGGIFFTKIRVQTTLTNSIILHSLYNFSLLLIELIINI